MTRKLSWLALMNYQHSLLSCLVISCQLRFPNNHKYFRLIYWLVDTLPYYYKLIIRMFPFFNIMVLHHVLTKKHSRNNDRINQLLISERLPIDLWLLKILVFADQNFSICRRSKRIYLVFTTIISTVDNWSFIH